jgi:leucyl aminopeptidase
MAEAKQADRMSSLPLHALSAAQLPMFLAALPDASASFLRASGFAAKPGDIALIPGADGLNGAVVGIGREASPWNFGGAPWVLPAGSRWHLVADEVDPAHAVLGWHLGAYRWLRHKQPGRAPAELIVPDGAEMPLMMAEAICAARDLINAPAAAAAGRQTP